MMPKIPDAEPVHGSQFRNAIDSRGSARLIPHKAHPGPGSADLADETSAESLTDARTAASAGHRPGYRLCERLPGEEGRATLEGLVSGAFERAHGARIHSFMPRLVGLEDPSGVVRSALGYRSGAEGRFFLEQYLDRPIEQLLAARLGPDAAPVDRSAIVEVGNLAGRGCRSALYLVSQMPRYLTGKGFSWITFTGTSRVRELLESFGAPLIDLGPADPARLATGADDWGRYYETAPRVMAGWLADGRPFTR